MSFLNPLLLLGALGVALPILAHLLNRYQVKRTPWAAMQFLNRSVRVRSRQLRLKDVLLMMLRCLAIVLLVLAFTRPIVDRGGPLGMLGEQRVAVTIALDASYSMQHQDEGLTRFDRALEKIEQIAQTIRPGDPVTLCLLGSEIRIVARNVPFDPEAFDQILRALEPTFEALDLNGVPSQLNTLADEMKAPLKEIYIVTDLQEKTWSGQSQWLNASLTTLTEAANVYVVPIEGGAENLAITELNLVSGVLRKGTMARYRATVRNCGSTIARNVRVDGMADNISMDVKVIPQIAPGASETVSLFMMFRDPGPVRISATIQDDGLLADNIRRTVAIVRDRVSVLCVQGSPEEGDGSAQLIAQALQARGNQEQENDLDVQTVSWVELPDQNLKAFDVVILADVPDITPQQAIAFEQYVRNGNGLIWFAGDQVKADSWAERSAAGGAQLLPAAIVETVNTSDAMGVGRPLDPSMTDHAVTRPLQSLPEDLLSEARFRKVFRLEPSATSTSVLWLAGSDSPLLVEQSLGRGHVFMFATSAGPAWSNMAVTPVFPMLLQQMVTYLTAREFETPRQVGDSLLLSYVDRPNTSDAVFDLPSGESVTVPVRGFGNQHVAVLNRASQVGFYLARANLQAEARPIAVNVNTRESDVKCMSISDASELLRDTGVRVTGGQAELLGEVESSRDKRSLWRMLLVGGLVFLVVESLLADWMFSSASRRRRATQADSEASP